MKPEVHLFILWERARYQQEKILADMRSRFTILKKFAITWTPELVSSNFTRFYGVNLPDKSFKEKECGKGEFLLCVVRDENPLYEERMTSRGPEVVNVNMFDSKSRFRSWTEGGHKVHGTNSEIETNHDLSLLIGKNIHDFLHDNPMPVEEIYPMKRDITGAHGWNSLSELFYILNNTIDYVVLRGEYELAIDNVTDNHRDVDLLVRNRQNAKYIINGVSCCNPHRPHELITIGGKDYYMDLWPTDANYFEQRWVNKMFENKILMQGVYALSNEDKFYSLLYHCFIFKGYIADDYVETLKALYEYVNVEELKTMLVGFLRNNYYEIVKPWDVSIRIHMEDPVISRYALRYGDCVRSIESTMPDIVTGTMLSWVSKVFKRENTFVKSGTPWLINNERDFLNEIGDGVHFPKLLDSGEDDGEAWFEMSMMRGAILFNDKWGIRINHLPYLLSEILDLLEDLYDKGVMHRDISDVNILVDGKHVALIDFGSAIHFRVDKEFPCPYNLGMGYAPEKMYSDFYNLAKIFEVRWADMPYVARIAKELKAIDWEHYQDTEFVKSQLAVVHSLLKRSFGIKDYWEFTIGKYRVKKYIKHPKRLIKRLLPASFVGKVKRKFKKVCRKIKL